MTGKQTIETIGDELAQRAPTTDVLINWNLWWFGAALILGAIGLGGAGIFLSLKFFDWGYLSRFGALIVIFGSFLIGRPVWRNRYKSRFVSATLIKDGQISDEQFAEYIMERTDVWFFYAGFIIAAVGSVIWGFADLLNCVSGEFFANARL